MIKKFFLITFCLINQQLVTMESISIEDGVQEESFAEQCKDSIKKMLGLDQQTEAEETQDGWEEFLTFIEERLGKKTDFFD